MQSKVNKQAAQLSEFLGALEKVADSRWPYEQKRRIENLNRAVNTLSFPGRTANRLDRIVRNGSLTDSALLRGGRLKKVLGKFASEKQAALFGKGTVKPPYKPGIAERMINFPFRHPKLTMFAGGVGTGYWLANKKNTTTNNNYYPEGQYQDYGAGYPG